MGVSSDVEWIWRGSGEIDQSAHPRLVQLLPRILVLGQRLAQPDGPVSAHGTRARVNDRTDSCVYFTHSCSRNYFTNVVLADAAACHDDDPAARLIYQPCD